MKRFLALMILLTGCGEAPPQKEPLRPVKTMKILPPGSERPLYLSGTSKANIQMNLSFRVSGTIEELPLVVGQRLKKGGLLARLEEQDFELAVSEAEASQQKVEAEARNALASYKRIKALWETGSASRNELDAARAAHESAKASVAKATSSYELARQQLEYSTLYAAFDECEVYEVFSEVGENVSVGQHVASLSCGRFLEVEVGVPESVIDAIKVGDDVLVEFNAAAREVYSGSVSEVGGVALAGATFPVTIKLDGSNPKLRSGMAAKVLFKLKGTGGEFPTLPFEAVGEDEQGNYVYILERNESGEAFARRRPVVVGQVSAGGITVEEGVNPGEILITAGLRYLTDGRQVKAEAP